MLKSLACASLLALSACASTPEPAAPTVPPDITLTPGLPAPPHANLYAGCIAQANATGAIQRERDGGTLRFTCAGDLAKHFFDALGPWSAKIGSETIADGRTYRFSKKLIKDSYGVDYCVAEAGAAHLYRHPRRRSLHRGTRRPRSGELIAKGVHATAEFHDSWEFDQAVVREAPETASWPKSSSTVRASPGASR